MHRVLANASRALSRLTGGPHGTTLCWRAAMKWGDYCAFCKIVGFVLRQPHHCADELSAQDIITRLKRK